MSEIELGRNAREQLAGFVERIESLTEEKAEVSERIKSEYAEAAGSGFDKKVIRQLIKERTADFQKTIEHRATLNAYRRALGGLAGTPLGDWARQWISTEARTSRPADVDPLMSDWMKKRGDTEQSGGHDTA